ncbi:MAG: hypothetical protein AAF170_17600, partial [Bacteroidota bacterium]
MPRRLIASSTLPSPSQPRAGLARAGALLVVALLASACGTSEGPPPPGEPVVIRVWHQKDAIERAFLESWVERYNASQDSVEIKPLFKETEELRNHYLFAAMGGKGADLIYGP